jgi:cysteine desulfurase
LPSRLTAGIPKSDMRQVYLDHIAATPLDPQALEAMLPFLRDKFGNPQSLHSAGQEALEALEEARSQVAHLVGSEAVEITFTSSGSEANNFALKGMAMARRDKGNHLVLSAIEHQSVLHSAKSLEKAGFSSTLVPVDRHGLVDPEAVRKAIRKETVLVSVILASSEVGTIEPVAEIAGVCRAAGVPLHTDAVAAVGNIPVDVRGLGVDALSLGADQFYGPKGSGALFVKKGVRILPIMDGGIQEVGRRAGTENVAGIVGMGKAAELAQARLSERQERMKSLRTRLIDRLPQKVDRAYLTGHPEKRLPHHASFCIEFIEGEGMLLGLDMKGIAVSSGSACTSRALKASHVLLAMGIDHALAQGSLVFSLLDSTAAEDIDYLLDVLPPVIDRLRKMSPLYTKFLEETKK